MEIDASPPVDLVRTLFREYAAGLPFALDFQDFDHELETLPAPYVSLLVAWVDGAAAGCAALRELDAQTGELKRLYVRDAFRGLGLGRALTEAAVVAARSRGYARIRLDTVPGMEVAQALYVSLGFCEVAPYRHNPIAGAAFLELELG